MRYHTRQDDKGPSAAWKYLSTRLDNKINQLNWRVVNLFIIGFGLGAIVATIIWFAVWHATGQPDMTGIVIR